MTVSAEVPELLRDAMEVYGPDPTALAELHSLARRLEEPLRVAIAGMVKAGKSTLLNALIGEEIAPTDAGECTRVVTWYRYADTPRVTVHPIAGEPRRLPVTRAAGRLVFDLGIRPEEVDRLVVDWPAKTLRDLTLVDTPGTASLSGEISARSARFLNPQGTVSEVDAIIYAMRHLHATDVKFLESFRDPTAGGSGIVNALAVLSRADEIGGGRLDSLVSAHDIVERYRRDDALRGLVLGVAPIAGLLAQSARTLRQAEFAALAELARLDRAERERLAISADRFVRTVEGVTVSPEMRATLLARFGLFGIRLATVLIRSGMADPTTLAHELARRSGLDELIGLIDGQFQARAAQLKARTALLAVETLLRDRPRAGTERLAASLERIQASAHEFRELQLLTSMRTSGLAIDPVLKEEAERLIGGAGNDPADRLDLPRNATGVELRAGALAALHRWRTLAENPLTDRATAEVCEIVVRSCEAIVADAQEGSGARSATRLILSPQPGASPG